MFYDPAIVVPVLTGAPGSNVACNFLVSGLTACGPLLPATPPPPIPDHFSVGWVDAGVQAVGFDLVQVTFQALGIRGVSPLTIVIDSVIDGVPAPLPAVAVDGSISVAPPVLDIRKTAVLAADACPATYALAAEGLGTPLPVGLGEDVKYCVNVINTGNSDAAGVAVTDVQAPGGAVSLTSTTLAAGGGEASGDYTLTVDAFTATVNTATVTGTYTGGDPVPSAQDPAEIAPVAPPALDIRKTVVPFGSACPASHAAGVDGDGPALAVAVGAQVTYCVNVINTGVADAENVAVADLQAPGPIVLDTTDVAGGGGEASGSYSLTVTAGMGTLNTATVSGTDTLGNPALTDEDTALIDPVSLPVLDIRKTVVPFGSACPASHAAGVDGDGPALAVAVGAQVTYCVNVINNGVGDAENVAVADSQAPGPIVLDTTDVAGSGGEASGLYSLTVTAGMETLNTATVSGTDTLDNPALTDEDTALIALVDLPILNIRKTVVPFGSACPASHAAGVDGDGPALAVAVGAQVTYCVNVINNGVGDAENVAVADSQAPGPIVLDTTDVAGGGGEASGLYSLTVTVGMETLNTATVSGTDTLGNPALTDEDTALIALVEPPILNIRKTVVPFGSACPASHAAGVDGDGPALAVSIGQAVTYCVNVLNTGTGDAANVAVADTQAPGGTVSLSSTVLAAGTGEASGEYTLTVTVSTPALNTATVSGTDTIDTPVADDEDTASIAPVEPPLLDIRKTVVAFGDTCPASHALGVDGDGLALPVAVGDTVRYCVNVLNTGLGDAANVAVADTQAPGGTVTLDTTDLVAGTGEALGQYTLVVAASTATLNTAIVSGDDTLDNPVATDEDTALIAPVGLPVLDIRKTVVAFGDTCPATHALGVDGDGPALPVSIGQQVRYCVNVLNTGLGDAANVAVADTQAPGGTVTLDTTDLVAGTGEASGEYTLLITGSTATLNTAIVSGTDSLDNPVATDEDTALIAPVEPPVLDIRKTVVAFGDTCPATHALGVDGDGPALAVSIGQQVRYCVNVLNTGTGDAANVAVADTQAPGGTVTLDTSSLVAGTGEASGEYTLVVAPSTATLNTAIVSGDDTNGNPVATDEDTTLIAPVEPPVLDIRKTVVAFGDTCPASHALGVDGDGLALPVAVGDTVRYCVNVLNTGTGDAANLAVADTQAPGGTVTLDTSSLVAGTGEASGEYTLLITGSTATLNTAIVSGDDTLDNPVATDEDTALIAPVEPPVLDIRKTVVVAGDACPATHALGVDGDGLALPVAVGDTVRYCVNVLNTGTGDAANVAVADTQAPGGTVTLDTSSLLAGTGEASGEYTLVVAPSTATLNTAIVSGTDTLDNPVATDEDTALIAPVEPPVLDIRKTVVAFGDTCPASHALGVDGDGLALPVAVGDTVRYCVNVLNTGTGDAANLAVADTQAPGGTVTLDTSSLVAGTGEASGEYTLVVAPSTATLNTAIVSGDDTNGNPVATDEDTALIAPAGLPVLDIRKTVVVAGDACPASHALGVDGDGLALPVAVGDTVRYCVNVLNSGLGDAANVAVADTQAPGGTVALDTTDLVAGTGEAFGEYTLVVAASAATTNTAIVSGTDTSNNPVATDQDTAVIDAVASPLATIGGFVWNDLNSDGIHGAGEPGIANITVEVLDGTTVVASDVTDAAGAWSVDVAAGTFTVRFVNTGGW